MRSSRLSQGCAAQSARVEVSLWKGALPEVTAFEPPERVGVEVVVDPK